jgi:hypothetical protein
METGRDLEQKQVQDKDAPWTQSSSVAYNFYMHADRCQSKIGCKC